MSESLEKEKYFQMDKEKGDPSTSSGQEKESPQVEVDPEVLRRLQLIAQRVGGDFGMQVEIGEPGKGSFYNPQEVKIILDPLHVKKNPELAEFVSAHEGSHRAITRGPDTIGLKKEKIEEMYSQIGFAYMNNCIEDPAVNDWAQNKFGGLKDNIDDTYEKMLKEENVPLGADHPDVQLGITMLGYIPRFVQFGSEIIRHWHQGRFSKELNSEVEKGLNNTKEDFKQSYQTIPGAVLFESEVIDKAKERFMINYEKVWPEFKRIVELDLNDEKLREMLEQMKSEAMDQLSKKDKKELQDKIEQGQREVEEQVKEKEKELSQTQEPQKQQELKNQIKDLKEQQTQAQPVAMDELTKELLKKLQEIYDSLPEDKKNGFAKSAQENLENLEDSLNKEVMQGKLNEDTAPAHQEIRQEQIREAEEKRSRLKETQEIEAARQRAREKLEAEKSDYQKFHPEDFRLIDELYDELKKVFIPQKHPLWIKGHPSGGRLDLLKAMQYDADKSQHDKLWERKTKPRKIDYKFADLVDLSGSVGPDDSPPYKTAKSLFRAERIGAEVFNRFGMDHGVYGYSGNFSKKVKKYKDFKEELADQVRSRLFGIIKESGGGTPMSAAFEKAYEEILANPKKFNFITCLTDGRPSGAYHPENILKRIREEGVAKALLFGVGKGTEYVNNLQEPLPESLKQAIAAELRIKPEGVNYSFKTVDDYVKAYPIILEDILKHPEKY